MVAASLALVPIREYMKKTYRPGHDLIRPLLGYFKELLELYQEFNGSQMSSSAAQILSNFANKNYKIFILIEWNGSFIIKNIFYLPKPKNF